MTEQQKYPFVSPAWIEAAAVILADVVEREGKPGERFSTCEVFAEVPTEFADQNGTAAWHFSTDGKTVKWAPGRNDNVDFLVQLTWSSAAKAARVVVTAETLPQMIEFAGKMPSDPNYEEQGDRTKGPAWMQELHNRLALITA